LVLAGVCSAATAAGAPAATLKISVPARVHHGQSYSIKITGSFKKSEVKGKAYLISVIQFSGKPCRATAQLENQLVAQFYLLSGSQAGIFESRSPFTRIDRFTANTVGSRRVCAYLYAKLVHATDKTAPIATADAPYKVIKKKR
jgi:hypothetical protein